MKISVLMENITETAGILQEHGLSLFIETKDRRILFDTGQTDGFLKNAGQMGVDVNKADCMILSHGHYDHGGGIKYFLECNSDAPIYLRASALEPHFSPAGKEIGIAPEISQSHRLRKIEADFSLGNGMQLVSMGEEYEQDQTSAYGFSVLRGGKKVPDDFRHEVYLEIQENSRKVLFSGCSHRGIWNIVRRFRPDVLIGGFHFKDVSMGPEGRAVLKKAAERLLQVPTVYYTCHCTGWEQYCYLKGMMGEKLHYLSAGQTVELR